jgi:hypothetical protein
MKTRFKFGELLAIIHISKLRQDYKLSKMHDSIQAHFINTERKKLKLTKTLELIRKDNSSVLRCNLDKLGLPKT